MREPARLAPHTCCGCGWAGCGAGSERALSEPIPPCRSFLRWCFEVVLAPKALALVLAPKALVFSSPGAEGPKQFMCPSVCVSLSPSPVVSLRKMRLGRPQGQKFSKGAFGGRFQRGPSAPAPPHILGPRQVLLPGEPARRAAPAINGGRTRQKRACPRHMLRRRRCSLRAR